MAVSMADITKLRKMTGAGMMDCKNALTESEGDFDKAVEIIRKKGQAVAAKRSDRETSEGCVLAKSTGDYAAMIALKCETDFVAKNADFVALTQAILDAAIANKCQTLDEVKALPMGNGEVVIRATSVEDPSVYGDITIVKSGFIETGIDNVNDLMLSIKLVENELRVEGLPKVSNCRLNIVDVSGRIIPVETRFGDGMCVMRVGNLSTGVYLLQITVGEKQETFHFIK